MEFSNAALCREKRGGGSHKHMHSVDQNCSDLCSSTPTTLPVSALCQGFSIAIRRAHTTLDNILISRVMGCVIQQPPIGSIKEWHPFIPK